MWVHLMGMHNLVREPLTFLVQMDGSKLITLVRGHTSRMGLLIGMEDPKDLEGTETFSA